MLGTEWTKNDPMAGLCKGGNEPLCSLNPITLLAVVVCIFGFKGASTSQVIGARNEIMMDDYDGQMIFGDLVGLKLPDIRLTGKEKPEKTSPRKLVPTGDCSSMNIRSAMKSSR